MHAFLRLQAHFAALAAHRRRLQPQGMRPLRTALACAAIALGLGIVPPARAESTNRADTSKEARDEAIRRIPWNHLDGQARSQVEAVLEKTSLYRRLPTQVVRCDPELYQFTIDNPEVLVNIWHLLGLEDIVLERTGAQTFRAADGAGTLGDLEILYAQEGKRLVYGSGTYDGPMFAKPIRGSCVLLLETTSTRGDDGYYYVTSQLNVFVRLEQVSIELLAKTFQPLVGKVADYNFEQTSAFISGLSRAAESNPRGMHRLAARLTDCPPALRDRFVEVTAKVYARAEERRALAVQSRPLDRTAAE